MSLFDYRRAIYQFGSHWLPVVLLVLVAIQGGLAASPADVLTSGAGVVLTDTTPDGEPDNDDSDVVIPDSRSPAITIVHGPAQAGFIDTRTVRISRDAHSIRAPPQVA